VDRVDSPRAVVRRSYAVGEWPRHGQDDGSGDPEGGRGIQYLRYLWQ
jgi:hypothetical protein